jgi:hypothetical protein
MKTPPRNDLTQEVNAIVDLIVSRGIGLGFHPDSLCSEYVNDAGQRLFTDEEADTLDARIDKVLNTATFEPYQAFFHAIHERIPPGPTDEAFLVIVYDRDNDCGIYYHTMAADADAASARISKEMPPAIDGSIAAALSLKLMEVETDLLRQFSREQFQRLPKS